MDLVKTMIQQSLWNMCKATGNEEYKMLYEKWHESYEDININGLPKE